MFYKRKDTEIVNRTIFIQKNSLTMNREQGELGK